MKTVLIVLSLISLPAYADCHAAYICDQLGQNCKSEQVCASPIDVRSSEVPGYPTQNCRGEYVNGVLTQVCR